MHRQAILILVLLTLTVSTIAQEDTCPRLIQNALTSVLLECDNVDAETLCYGNSLVAFAVKEGAVPEFIGDRVPLSDLVSFQGTSPDSEAGIWGINLMNLLDDERANPATLAAFGDVSLINLGTNTPFIQMQISSSTGAYIRSAPSADAALKTTLIRGETIYATGRLEDDSWLRVELDQGQIGWLSSGLVTLADEASSISVLPVINPVEGQQFLYRPLRDFELVTGIDEAKCRQAPASGLLIQTEPDSQITLNINQIAVTLEGTVFMQAPDEQSLYLYALEEESRVSVRQDGFIYQISGGDRLILSPNTSEISTYNYTLMEVMPVELLPRQIVIPTNWIDALIPAQENPLADVTPESTCTVAAAEDVNIRTGPGRDYPVRGSMLANQSAHPQGRAVGTDNGIWWRITPGAWLRFDVVFLAGRCDDVPNIDLLPRPPREG